jgi:hypothetical protein
LQVLQQMRRSFRSPLHVYVLRCCYNCFNNTISKKKSSNFDFDFMAQQKAPSLSSSDYFSTGLNTCVGKANYNYFFRTMISINLMLLVQAAVQIAIVLDIYLGDGATKERAEAWFSSGTTIPVVAIMGVFIFFDVASLSLIGQLLVFHLKLQKEGISTYGFIVRDNKNRRERTKKLNELKVRRQTEIATARENCKTFLALRLEMGGLLREKFGMAWCDPLLLDADDSNNNNSNGNSNGNTNSAHASNGHTDDGNEDA